MDVVGKDLGTECCGAGGLVPGWVVGVGVGAGCGDSVGPGVAGAIGVVAVDGAGAGSVGDVADVNLTPVLGVLKEKDSVMGRRSKFDEEFRSQAVEMVRVSGRARCRVAADLGI